MAKNITLKDSTTSEDLYPVTLVDNVMTSDGTSIGHVLENNIAQFNAAGATAINNLKTDTITSIFSQVSVANTVSLLAMESNKFYTLGVLASNLLITLIPPTNTAIRNEYGIEFDGSYNYRPTFPASVIWNEEPTFGHGGCHYEISIRYDSSTQRYYGMYVEIVNPLN